MNAALIIIFGVLLLSIFLGIRAQKGKDMNLEQWTVGGRGFGTVFVFLLMAGEIYTTFTFLGGSGWAYGKGGPAFYIIAYGCLAYILSYWLLPAVWTYAKQHKLMSQSDFFTKKIQQSAAWHSRFTGRHRRTHSLSCTAAERSRADCIGNLVRQNHPDRRHLDRRCFHHGLCYGFRHSRVCLDIGCEGHHDSGCRSVFRCVFANSLLRRISRHVSAD